MTRNEIVRRLEGVICAAVTPFNRRGQVDEGAFCENLNRISGVGLAGILVAGSTGEAPYLSETERLRLIEIARQAVKAPAILIAGTGLESTHATVKLSREAVARGADALLVLTPNYYKARMDSGALVAHYRKVAAAVARPVLVYTIPQFTGLDVDAATIAKLSRLPNVVGLKDSSGRLEFVRGVLSMARPGFRVLVGSPAIFHQALCEGATGGVLGLANFAPSLCVSLYQAFLCQRRAEADQWQQSLLVLAQKIAAPFGVGGIKAALDLSGFQGGAPRLPLLSPSGQAKRQIAVTLRQVNAH